MRKMISLLLAAAIFISFPAVFAEEEERGLSAKQTQALELVDALGIYEGINESNALETITRAEFSKLAVRLLGAEELPEMTERIYADVMPEDDAAASIAYLYQRGIMNGCGNALFCPDDNITLEQAVKVLVAVYGYSVWAEYQGGYSDGYYKIAMENGFLSGVKTLRAEEISWADAAVIIRNILESNNYLVAKSFKEGYPVESRNNDEAYMEYVLGVYKYVGIVEAVGPTALSDSATEYGDGICIIGGENFFFSDVDVLEYLGQKVNVYYKEGDLGEEIVYIEPDRNCKVIDIEDIDISDNTTKTGVEYYDGNRTRTAAISAEAIYIYNGKATGMITDEDMRVKNGRLRLISNDGGSKYNVVIIESYETGIVDKAVLADELLVFKYSAPELSLGEKNGITAKYYIDGEEAEFSAITGGSVLSIAMSKNSVGNKLAKILISNEKIKSKAVSVRPTDRGKAAQLENGEEYEYTDEFLERIEKGTDGTYEPTLDMEGDFYIDAFGRIAAFLISSEGKNYGYVVRSYWDEDEEKGVVRIFTKDASFENFTVSDKIKINDVKVDTQAVTALLRESSPDGTVNQLIIYKANSENEIISIKTAKNKTNELYYIAKENEFILNAHPKNNSGEAAGLRFYKNMAENKPYSFVDGKTIQFMVPTDKTMEKAYKIGTKLSSTDVSLPAPLYIYDAGAAGAIGAVVSNTASEGKYSSPKIVDSVAQTLDDEGDPCTSIVFVGGTSVIVGDEVIYDQPPKSDSKGNINWRSRIDYTNITINDLKRGDVIEYTTLNDKVEMLRVIVKSDNIGPVRIDGDHIQLNGNMIADVISVSDNGRTAMVYYVDRFGEEHYQTMLVNGPVYRYDSSQNKVYSSSVSDMREGDRVLINSYWWSPKLIVIFR